MLRMMACVAASVLLMQSQCALAKSDCEMTRSLTGVIGDPFRHISIRMKPGKGVQLLVRDQPYLFSSMDDCSLDATADSSDDAEATLDCDWFYDDPKEAQVHFEKIVKEFDRCLPSPLNTYREEKRYDKHLKIASADIEHETRRGTTDVHVKVIGFPDYKERDKKDWVATRYWVGLNISYELEPVEARK